MRQSLIGLELAYCVSPFSQLSPRLCLSLLPQSWHYKCHYLWLFSCVLKIKLKNMADTLTELSLQQPPPPLNTTVYASLFLCGFVHMNLGAWGGQKKLLDPLELEVHVVVSGLLCMLGTEPRPSLKVTCS